MDNLNEIAARWLGLTIDKATTRQMGKVYIRETLERSYPFDPLHDMNDLMNEVVVKLPKNIRIIIGKGEFIIGKIPKGTTRGSYPADFPTAVLELVKELEGGEE